MTFTHLHLHSEYSLLDGAIRFKDLVPYLKEKGMGACALTDHGFLGGTIEFQKQLKKENLKPILGCEAYITEDADDTPQDLKNRDNLHAVLLCKDIDGLRGLFKLQTEAATHNFYYKPRIHRPKLEELAGHVVVTTACLKGILTNQLMFERDIYGRVEHVTAADGFQDLFTWYLSLFGEDFYLELQDWDDGTQIQYRYNEFLLELAHRPSYIITSDCHYLRKEDHELHEIMMAGQLKMTLADYRAQETMRYGPFFYVKDPAEMKLSADRWGIGLESTQEIADKCNCEIELGTYHPPVFNPEEAPDWKEYIQWKSQRLERS